MPYSSSCVISVTSFTHLASMPACTRMALFVTVRVSLVLSCKLFFAPDWLNEEIISMYSCKSVCVSACHAFMYERMYVRMRTCMHRTHVCCMYVIIPLCVCLQVPTTNI